MGRIITGPGPTYVGIREDGVRSSLSSPNSGLVFTTLPNAGPFAGVGIIPISGLPDVTANGGLSIQQQLGRASTQANPYMINNLTINMSWLSDPSLFSTAGLFFLVNTLHIGGNINANAGDGQAGDPCTHNGGNGGDGASGGFPGGGAPGCCGLFSGTDGAFGNSWGIGVVTYAYPTGGATGAYGCCGGVGPGFGEGGAGCAGGIADPREAGGGGGAGGPLISIYANTIIGVLSTAALNAAGGSPGLTSFGNLFSQQGGGGGVIDLGARVYAATLQQSRMIVSGGGNGAGNGVARISQINSNLTTTVRAFNQSWSS